MGWTAFGILVMALIAVGGAYQLITGRYVGLGRFAGSYNPSARMVRIAGCAGIIGGIIGALILLGHPPT